MCRRLSTPISCMLHLHTESARRKAVTLAVELTSNTPLAPRRYERHLLSQYQNGVLTIDEVLESLDDSVYHIAYRSRSTQFPTEEALNGLLEWSRHYNAQHRITGLLLYSEGHFVQVIEGPEAEVSDLFARIQQDPRHTQVLTLSQGPGPQRYFPDWRMAFGLVAPSDLDVALGTLATAGSEPLSPLDDPYLRALLLLAGDATNQRGRF